MAAGDVVDERTMGRRRRRIGKGHAQPLGRSHAARHQAHGPRLLDIALNTGDLPGKAQPQLRP